MINNSIFGKIIKKFFKSKNFKKLKNLARLKKSIFLSNINNNISAIKFLTFKIGIVFIQLR